MEQLSININLLKNYNELKIPEYATEQASGMDLRAAILNEVSIDPMERKLIETGISIELPQGYEGQIRARSGLALKYGITVLNGIGTIDADYRGELKVILINLSSEKFIIKRGMRIAQLVIAEVRQSKVKVVNRLSYSQRSINGFGSTGI